jgi:hypothetical protein
MAFNWDKLSPEEKAELIRKRSASRRKNADAKRAAKAVRLVDLEDVSLPTGYGSAGRPFLQDEEEAGTPPEPSSAPNPADPFQIWLLALDSETRELFSEKELRADFDELWRQVQEEKKKSKRKAARELGLSTVRSQLGMLPLEQYEAIGVAKQNAKPVSMMIELPPAMDDGAPPDVGLRINGGVIPHGKRWAGTYGEAASLREMLYRVAQHELRFKGVGLRSQHYLMQRALGTVPMQFTEQDLAR